MNRALRVYVESVATGEAPRPALVERARRDLGRDEAARARRMKKSLPRRKDKAARHASDSDAVKVMWAGVMAWNLANTRGPGAPAGRCDCGCGTPFRHATDGEVDHWIEKSQGGEDHRENGWRLISEHHRMKTDREPPPGDGPPTWNERRADYCRRAGIEFVERKEGRHG